MNRSVDVARDAQSYGYCAGCATENVVAHTAKQQAGVLLDITQGNITNLIDHLRPWDSYLTHWTQLLQ